MIIHYYYLTLVPFVVAFRGFPLRNIIIGRAVFATVVETVNTEICTAPNLCMAVLNTNDRNPMQIIYLITAAYTINVILKENAAKDEKKGLDTFTDYTAGRRMANALLIVWAVLFTKNIDPVL